jgi:hypothetical protein
MIKGIVTSSKYIEITGGGAGTYVSKSYNSGVHNQGQMMYDLDAQCIKVFDGQHWIVLSTSSATVNMSYQAQTALDWAQKKMEDEAKMKALADQYPAVKDLKEKLDLVLALVKDYETDKQS